MAFDENPVELSPSDFEKTVKGMLDAAAGSLVGYESKHLESLEAPDGEYAIDVTARFQALGAAFLVLVECKHHRRRIERKDVQVLLQKVQSLGAQKGILFSTSGFQEGAIAFADAHGIGLVKIADGSSTWFVRSEAALASPPPDWVPEYVGWWCQGVSMSVVSTEHVDYMRKLLGISDVAS
ncbi:restriction endonuclease [Herbaspirillum seropedicae]|uniref:restriction endonuclease n=1 Tax=Herbaspirillum seropedicae TaxID=964 RepID=UPI003F8D5058